MSQIGYMVLAAGLGPVGYVFAIVHLLTHGFFKAGLFLGAGSVMHAMNDDREHAPLRRAPHGHGRHLRSPSGRLPRHHRASRRSPGFFSKDKIIEAAFATNTLTGLVTPARRRHHGVLHDPPDGHDVLRRGPLGGRRAPARVAHDHDRADRRARVRSRPSAASCSPSTPPSSTGSSRCCRSRSPSSACRWPSSPSAPSLWSSSERRSAGCSTPVAPSPSSPLPATCSRVRPAPTSTATRSTRPSSCVPAST